MTFYDIVRYFIKTPFVGQNCARTLNVVRVNTLTPIVFNKGYYFEIVFEYRSGEVKKLVDTEDNVKKIIHQYGMGRCDKCSNTWYCDNLLK